MLLLFFFQKTKTKPPSLTHSSLLHMPNYGEGEQKVEFRQGWLINMIATGAIFPTPTPKAGMRHPTAEKGTAIPIHDTPEAKQLQRDQDVYPLGSGPDLCFPNQNANLHLLVFHVGDPKYPGSQCNYSSRLRMRRKGLPYPLKALQGRGNPGRCAGYPPLELKHLEGKSSTEFSLLCRSSMAFSVRPDLGRS